MSVKAKATTLFRAKDQLEDLETELHNVLGENFMYTDFTYDSYDTSLEIFGVPENKVLSDEELLRLKKFGFGQVWTHTAQVRGSYPEPGEKHYILYRDAMFEEEKT